MIDPCATCCVAIVELVALIDIAEAQAVETLAPRFVDGSLKTVAREISAAGQAQAAVLIAGRDLAPLPSALVERRQAVSESVEKFSHRIPEMIVVGRLLAAATNKENQQ